MVTGRYRLVESIGQGGMGRVWRAADEMLDRPVAVKEMRIDGLDAEDARTRRERTLREARATARIDHPNVVRVYDVVDEGERLWIVMELVAGRSLERVTAEDGPLGPRETAMIGLGLVEALSQVHARGVLHRDIKPGNVLVEHGARRIVLTDFGIAAIQDTKALTMVGMLVGSPDYMAPERVSGRPQGPPSDVWSLGATLCASLAGRSPFSRDTTLATLHAVLYEQPELPSEAGPLSDVLAALLDKEPAARPGLEELRTALHAVAFPAPAPEPDALPVPAPRPPEPHTVTPIPIPIPPPTADPSRRPADAPTPPVDPSRVPPAADSTIRPPAPATAPPAPSASAPHSSAAIPESSATAPPSSAPAPESPGPARHPWVPSPGAPAAASDPSVATPDPSATASGPAAPPRDPSAPSVPTPAPPTQTPPVPTQNPPAPPPDASVPTQAPPVPSPDRSVPPPDTVTRALPRPVGGGPPEEPTATAVPPARGTRRAGVSLGRADAVTEQRPAPDPAGVPPGGEPPGPARPSTPRRTRRTRRRVALIAAAGVVTAGTVAGVVLASALGSPDGSRAGGEPGTPSATASSTVEGTSRPPSLPPGVREEAGGFAWRTPEGWRRDVKTGAEVHYTSPDGTQELVAKSSLARGDLMDSWRTSERNARQGRDYRKIRLEETTFRGHPAVIWEYTFTLEGVPWHARLLGFDAKGKSYQINTWYQPAAESRALAVYDDVKRSFVVL
ncbi:serine/threonine protein kinase [Streptomyces cadmiisoli]|uniref:non-specific serine/threonine protein kinase n=2 Tax=Streptomyces cadmiisoli TaxID=2184053 RepID=A0A2Z4JBX3_9ACTN|nr:serine/threonine protein kinase [Streptomyces cadmiisoli]